MPEVKDDVKDMLDNFLDKPPEEIPPVETPPAEAPPTETPPVEAPPEEKPPEEKPPVEAPPEEKPPEEVPPVEAPPEVKPPEEKPPEEPPVPPTDMELLQRQNQLLLERIEKISGGDPVQPVVTPEVKPDEKPDVAPTPAPAPPTPIKIDEINFLEGKTQEEVERIVENPVELNKIFNQIYLRAIEQSIPLAQERSLLAIPQVVVSHLQRYNTMKGLVDDFYKENKDLKVVQRSVGMIANEVHSEHTDWTTKQVFDEAAVRTRKALGLAEPPAKPTGGQPPVTPTNAPPADPAFANPQGSRRRGPAGQKLTGIAKEIDDLMPDRD